jgi:hypothetical protein
VSHVVRTAWEGVILVRAAPAFQPSLEAGPSRFEQLKLDRPPSLLLCNRSSRSHPAAADQLADSDFDYVAPTQLAVDCKVEERAVAKAPFPVEPKPNGPDLLRLEGAFRADHTSSVPRPPLPDCRIEL